MLVFCAGYASADVPWRMNYQGRLLDAGGQPVSKNVSVEVKIYSQETEGSALYTEAIGMVSVVNGIYSFKFGAESMTNALAASEAWLELIVDSETLTPRKQLVAVPYALRAKEAEVLSGSSVGYVLKSGDTMSGDLVLGGNSLSNAVLRNTLVPLAGDIPMGSYTNGPMP